VDFKGPLHDKEWYLLVVLDNFTKYAWGTVFKRKDCEPVANWMYLLFVKDGPPKIWQSDNGGEFVNECMKGDYSV
jgi:hypothetical protein